VPLSGGRFLIDEGILLDLVDQMRAAVPQDIREAERVLGETQRLLTQAREEAQRIIASAQDEVRQRVSESAILQQAEQQAQTLLEEARRQASSIVSQGQLQADDRQREADRYASELLRRLEVQLTGFLGSVRQGIENLEPARRGSTAARGSSAESEPPPARGGRSS